MKVQQYREFLFILGEQSIDIFDYFGVDELHGLTRTDCNKKQDTELTAYIAGLCNYIPNKTHKYNEDSPLFIFINSIINSTVNLFNCDITQYGHFGINNRFIFN